MSRVNDAPTRSGMQKAISKTSVFSAGEVSLASKPLSKTDSPSGSSILSQAKSREVEKRLAEALSMGTLTGARKFMNRRFSQKPASIKEAVHIEVAEELDPELEKLLQTAPLNGLSDSEVQLRLEKFGKNEIPEHRTNHILKFLSYFLGSISYLLEVACLLSVIFGDYVDFGILLFVLIANACIGYFEEARAESALDALKNTLAQKSRVWRNSKLVEIDSSLLVPGDIIALVSITKY
jgi:magnesium-transporting ATPase (P-type)